MSDFAWNSIRICCAFGSHQVRLCSSCDIPRLCSAVQRSFGLATVRVQFLIEKLYFNAPLWLLMNENFVFLPLLPLTSFPFPPPHPSSLPPLSSDSFIEPHLPYKFREIKPLYYFQIFRIVFRIK